MALLFGISFLCIHYTFNIKSYLSVFHLVLLALNSISLDTIMYTFLSLFLFLSLE